MQPSLPLELWIEIMHYIHISAGSFTSLSQVNKTLRTCCIPRLFTSIYMKPTKAKKTVKQLFESPVILDAVRTAYFRPARKTWLPRRSDNVPSPYDDFVTAMWRMPHLAELHVQGIGNFPVSLIDFMVNNTTLKRLSLFNVTIPPSTFHSQPPLCGYWSIEAAGVGGVIEHLFSNSSSTLQRLEIGSQFPMKVIAFLSQSSSRFSRLVTLTIGKSLTQEESSWVCRLLGCCPVLETLSLHSKFPSPMSTIPPDALPRLHSLRADVDGHALVLLDSPVRRVSALTLTLKGPLAFRSLQGLQSQPTFISGEIAYEYLTTSNDDFHRLVLNCRRFYSVVVPSGNPIPEVRNRSPQLPTFTIYRADHPSSARSHPYALTSRYQHNLSHAQALRGTSHG
jgi:hypothetical protein